MHFMRLVNLHACSAYLSIVLSGHAMVTGVSAQFASSGSVATHEGAQVKRVKFLDHQSIFDNAVTHLMSQGRAALLPCGGGAYRAGGGTCPIGQFIQPKDYST